MRDKPDKETNVASIGSGGSLVPEITPHSAAPVKLTLASSGASGVKGKSDENDSMADDPRLEKAFALIREVIADERQKTIDDIMRGVQSGATSVRTSYNFREKARRAPPGSARLLCERALSDAGEHGLTAHRIHEMAANEYERMLTISAVRNELGVGEKANPQRYRNVGGVWYLPKHAPTMKVVG